MKKIILKNYKNIISWLLILIVIFTGINWPSFSSSADVTNEFELNKFDADANYPYLVMFLDKNTLGNGTIEKNIYAIKSNTPLYYMADYELIVSEDKSETNFGALYYKWDDSFNTWANNEDFTSTYDENMDRHILMCSLDIATSQISENKISYILEKDLTDANFDIADYDDGIYIIGYDSLTTNKDLLTLNYLQYEEDSSVSNAEILEINKFFFADILVENQIFSGIDKIVNLKDTSSNNERPFDFSNLKIGDSFPLSNQLLIPVDDSIMTGQTIILNLSYTVNAIYKVDGEGNLEIITEENNVNQYVNLSDTEILLGGDDETSQWVNEDFIVELQASTRIAGSTETTNHMLYLNVKDDDASNDSAVLTNKFNEFIKLTDSTNKNFEFVSFINAVNSNFNKSTDRMVSSKVKILNKQNIESKTLNNFRIYNMIQNNHFNLTNLDFVSEDIVDYEITEIEGIKNLSSLTNLSDYIEISYNNNGYSELKVDGNKITKYRRDNRNAKAFASIVVKTSLNGYNDSYFKVDFDVVQYIYGETMETLPEGIPLKVADIEFGSSLSGTYGPMVSNLIYLDFANTYQTLVNYSDYQLLFYTTEVPLLNEGHYLEFNTDSVSIEIYKNTKGNWSFYNYLENIEDARINLPEKSGYRSIEFNSYSLVNKVTNEEILAMNKIDEYYNMQLRGSKLPSTYLNGSESIYSNADGYNYYYLIRKGQNTYFMYKTNEVLSESEGLLSLPIDFKCYALMQNIWVPCSTESIALNDFNLGFAADFKNYLVYTNDSTYGTEIPTSRIGSVDYFKYIPNFSSINGYDYIIAETSEGLVAIQWKDATLTVKDGILCFKDKIASFDVKKTLYKDYYWLESESILEGIDSEGFLNVEGLVGSIIYSSSDIFDESMNTKVFSSGYSNSSIVVEELADSDYACTVPDLINVIPSDNIIDINDYTDNGENSKNVLLRFDGVNYHAYYVPFESEIFFDDEINITSEDNDPDLYISLAENESVHILKTIFDTTTNTWKYNGYETFTQSDKDTIKYLYYHLDFDWYGKDISCPNDENRNLISKKINFAGESNEDTLKDFQIEIDGKLYTYTFINGKAIFTDDKVFAQYVNNPDNYWILVSDSFRNIYDPMNNSGKFEVGTDNSMSFELYAPLYSSVVNILSAKADKTDIVSLGAKTNLYTNENSWFSGNDINDEGKPIINTVYVVNQQIKVSVEDPVEYQKSFYETEDFDRFIINNGRVYEKIPADYYEQIDSTPVNGIEPKILINGHCYELKDESYTFSSEPAETINGKAVYYVLQDDDKFIRREVIGNGTYTLYTPTGIYDSYIKILEDGTIFNEEVSVIVDGNPSKIEAGVSIPKDALVCFNKAYIPTPTEERNVILYSEDKFGNISREISLAIGPNANNEVIYGVADENVQEEIDEAIEAAKTDSLAPEIYYGYIYKGKLYLGIKDVAQVGSIPSGLSKTSWSSFIQYTNFENSDSVLYDNITIIDDNGNEKVFDFSQPEYISLVLGDLLPGSEWAWDGIKGNGLKITGNSSKFDLIKDANGKIQSGIISLGARDINFNESETKTNIVVSEELNNTILFGASNVPIDIIKMLEDAKNGTGNEGDIDTKPVIEAIYVLNSILYVEASDDNGIKNYGFQWKYLSTMKEDFTGKVVTYNSNNVIDEIFENKTIKAGDTIKAKTICYRNENFMAIKVPNALTIEVVDTAGNKTTRSVYPTSENQVIYGDVSETIKDLISANGGSLNPPEENSYPVITSVYTYRGYLYVEGYANDGLHTYAYGFKVDEDSIYPGQFTGYDMLDNYINISAGRVISSGTKVFKDINYQRVNFPTLVTISIRDITNDETSLSLNVLRDNMLYYGEPPILKDENGNDITLDDGRNENENNNNNGSENEGSGGSGSTIPGNDDDNVTEENNGKPGIILPDDSLEDIDWTLYDYVLQLLDEDTERIVYSIRKDEAQSIELPKLQDSTTYIYKQLVVDEATEKIEKTVVGNYSTPDTIAPIITKVWFSNYRLYVSAFDEGGLAEKPYLFSIQGTPVSNKEYSSSNNIRVVYNDRVSITVVDEAGNETTIVVNVKKNTESVLYECVNPKVPVFVRTGTSKSVSYWLAYLQTKYNIAVDGFEVDETNCSNIAFTSKDGDVVFDFSNDGVLTYYNEKTNKYYALTLRTLNAGKSYRSIIVQKGSEIDFALAFERKLLDLFGTTDGITWATDSSNIIKRDSSMVLANNVGVAKIVASKDNKQENFYIVVGENISSVKNSVNFKNENFAYTYLVKDSINLVDVLKATESETKYIVLDSSTDGISRVDDNTLKVNKVGRQTIMLLDVVNDELLEYTFEAVLVAPFISTFTDIIGSENRVDIEYLCERGVISQYPDLKYKSANKMTTKEFLTMLNKVRLTYDSDFILKKEDKKLNLDKRDFDYFSSMNILSNLTQEEVDKVLGSYTLNKAIAFEEVVALISSTLLYDEYHTQDGYKVPDGLENVSDAALHLLSIGIINEDDARNGTREVTKAEIAYMLSQTIRFLEY